MDGPMSSINDTLGAPGPNLAAIEAGVDLGPLVLGVCWGMAGTAAVFLGARLYVKLTTHKRLWWDDHLLVASWILLVAFCSATTYATTAGLGRHNGISESDTDSSHMQLSTLVATVFSVMGAAWSKTSFALTLLRITSGTIHYVIWFIIISMNVIMAFNAILQFIWCQPASAAWRSGRGGTCWSTDVIINYSIAAAAYSAAMDILLVIVPWVVVMRLKMQTKEKIGIAVCMSLGLIAAMTSIFRAVHIPSIYAKDYTFRESQLFIWTGAEVSTTIIAASIPVLRALLRNIVNSAGRTHGTTNTFKTGTYVCSTVSRAQSYKRMNTNTTSASQKPKRSNGPLDGISEDGESLTSLVSLPDKTFERFTHGGIRKTEEIMVNYDRRSQDGSNSSQLANRGVEFELEDIPPIYSGAKTR